jgi:hypothetical protein
MCWNEVNSECYHDRRGGKYSYLYNGSENGKETRVFAGGKDLLYSFNIFIEHLLCVRYHAMEWEYLSE